MAIELSIAETLYQSIDQSLAGTIKTGTSSLMIGVGSLFCSFWLINKTITSINWYFNGFNSVLKDEIINAIKSAFIIYSAFHVDWYMSVVVPFVNGMPTWAIQQLSSGAVGNNQVDALINSFINGIVTYTNSIKFSLIDDFKATIIAIITLGVMLIGGIPFLALCVATLMTLKVSTSLFLVVGPLFIAFSLFDQTRQYFWGWVSLLGGFMLTQLIFGVAITLEINFLNAFVLKDGKIGDTLGSAFALLFYFGTFSAIATEIPNQAARVMGGSPGGTHGLKGLMMKGTGLGVAFRMAGSFRNRIGGA